MAADTQLFALKHFERPGESAVGLATELLATEGLGMPPSSMRQPRTARQFFWPQDLKLKHSKS